MYKRWDVWLASVDFEDSEDKKDRPVLVMSGDNGVYVFAIKMTSRVRKGSGDYLVQDWGKAGLNKETVVRASKLLQIPISDMKHRIGRLTMPDIIKIDRIIKTGK